MIVNLAESTWLLLLPFKPALVNLLIIGFFPDRLVRSLEYYYFMILLIFYYRLYNLRFCSITKTVLIYF